MESRRIFTSYRNGRFDRLLGFLADTAPSNVGKPDDFGTHNAHP
jgi:hypothetical protein